jgi:hypothetical protein
VKISPVYSLPVFLKVPMVAMFFLRFAVSGPRPCGLDGDRQPGGDRWRTPFTGLDSTGGTFLSREE